MVVRLLYSIMETCFILLKSCEVKIIDDDAFRVPLLKPTDASRPLSSVK